MSKAAHNIPPKRLSVEIKKTIALDAVVNTISSAARQHQVTNKTAARQKNKALEAALFLKSKSDQFAVCRHWS